MMYLVDVLVALAFVTGFFVIACLVVGGLIAIDYLIIKVANNIVKKLFG